MHQQLQFRPQGKTRFLQKSECCAGALEGRFIATLCRLTGAKTVLEVGMFTGAPTGPTAVQCQTSRAPCCCPGLPGHRLCSHLAGRVTRAGPCGAGTTTLAIAQELPEDGQVGGFICAAARIQSI